MSFITQTLTALKRIFIVIGIAIAFTFGLVGAIYLSLRSSNTTVPDIVGKDRASAENSISAAGLNFRVRAMRPSSNAKPDTVIIQVPESGKIVKVGQTVAVDICRPSKEGETPTSTNANENSNSEKKPENSNATNSDNNANDNKQKKKPANKNGNDNLNGNTNRPANRNRNANANANPVTNGNVNANPGGTPVHNLNSNNVPKGNANRGAGNVNANRRPPVTAPTP
ncbi:MAG TPA: PASTA domain-containing protein [Pyrinomonadaceae bacterium]|nr:PASTA domain-containing protein [Pyrinomonadaceae bacterium]